MGGFIVVIVLAILVIIIVAKTAVVVPQQSAFVVERLGKYSGTLGAGSHHTTRPSTAAAEPGRDRSEPLVASVMAAIESTVSRPP